jgi:hypothetical protein
VIPVLAWLEAGVPITLLCDLASTADPQSHAINLSERPPGDLLAVEALLARAEVSSEQRAASG